MTTWKKMVATGLIGLMPFALTACEVDDDPDGTTDDTLTEDTSTTLPTDTTLADTTIPDDTTGDDGEGDDDGN